VAAPCRILVARITHQNAAQHLTVSASPIPVNSLGRLALLVKWYVYRMVAASGECRLIIFTGCDRVIDVFGNMIERSMRACVASSFALCVAIEAKQPYIRETLEPFERAGFFVYNLHNDYLWVIENKIKPPTRVSFEELYAKKYMVDILLTRREIPFEKLNSHLGVSES
jgi:hypothetical protein